MLLATDRVSAFDRALSPAIPGKGSELTAQTTWWRERLPIATDVDELPDASELPPVPDELTDRATVARRLEMIPVECVARGYLVGSAWAQYRLDRRVGGQKLPRGLEFGERLDDPLFTPTTKAPPGSADQPLTSAELRDGFGSTASHLAELTLSAYREAESLARSRGLLIADVKFEFGVVGSTGVIVFADELVTGDSSRPMSAADWEAGRVRFYGKENIRQWLREADTPAAPVVDLPADIVEATAQSYRDLTARLNQTG